MKNDLISRQAAIDALEKVADMFPWRVPGNRDTYDRYNEAWNDAIGRAEMEIENMPSAQPEIIRCAECKWFQCNMSMDGYLPKGVDEFECRHWCGSCDPVDFCSYAERETNESD